MKRREFLLGAVASAAGVMVAAELIACRRTPLPDFGRFKVFPQPEARALDAVLQALLPAASGMPSARETHVIDYFDGELQKSELKQLASAIRYGVEMLNRAAKKAGADNFADLEAEQQSRMLRDFSKNNLRVGKEDTEPIFNHLLAFTIEGYLSDPKYGGNFECKGWRAVGFVAGCEHG